MRNIFLIGWQWLQYRSVQVFLAIAIYLLLADCLSLTAHRGLYTISVWIKDILVWILPITVGLFIAHAVSSFHRRAPLFIGVLILFEALSNLSSVWYAFGIGQIAAEYLPPIQLPALQNELDVLYRLPFLKPAWWSADKGTFLGLALGCLASFTGWTLLKRGIEQGKEVVQWVLTRIFSRLIPFFVLGFVARMHETKVLNHVAAHYGMLVIWLLVFLGIYLVFLFIIAGDGTWKGTLRGIKNLIPAGGIAFTSGCSLSTMPWTIEGAGKNLQNPQFAKAIIPATTNIQQIGDCIINTFLCFLIYKQFYGHNPDLVTWVYFSFVFVLARFATAAVIGGAIFIMLPIYETYLSFNPEMIAIILAFNVVLDPIVTSSNVIANGALCRIFEKVWIFIHHLTAKEEPN